MPLISVAQYFPLVKNNAIWRESITQYDGSTFTHYRNQFVLLGDTLIDSKMYKKLYNANYDSILTNLEYGGEIREDRRKKCFF